MGSGDSSAGVGGSAGINFLNPDLLFRSKVLTLLVSEGKITPDHINLLKSWKHSGFQVCCVPRIHPRKKGAMEKLARYIIRASFSQERMTYLPEESRIICRSKDKRQEEAFDALEWPFNRVNGHVLSYPRSERTNGPILWFL